MTRETHLLLGERQRLPRRNFDLPFHQIEARDHLGHGMLDLKTCVHFKEEELFSGRDEKLNRARPFVVHRVGSSDRRLSHAFA